MRFKLTLLLVVALALAFGRVRELATQVPAGPDTVAIAK